MKNFLKFSVIFLLLGCSKPKTVLICGDHICVNNKEAEQFFEENLSIEVKIIDKKEKEEIDLVALNLSEDPNGQKKISVSSIKNTNENLKILSKEEIKSIKNNINNKKKNKKVVKKIQKKDKNINKKKPIIKKTNNINKKKVNVADVCKILEKCNIREISKYLLKQGIKKDYPDITIRQ